MLALGNGDARAGREGIGLPLLREGLDMALAVLVDLRASAVWYALRSLRSLDETATVAPGAAVALWTHCTGEAAQVIWDALSEAGHAGLAWMAATGGYDPQTDGPEYELECIELAELECPEST